jgi:hypothetical protein
MPRWWRRWTARSSAAIRDLLERGAWPRFLAHRCIARAGGTGTSSRTPTRRTAWCRAARPRTRRGRRCIAASANRDRACNAYVQPRRRRLPPARRGLITPGSRSSTIAVTRACWPRSDGSGVAAGCRAGSTSTAAARSRRPPDSGSSSGLPAQGAAPVFIPTREPWRNGIIEHFNDTFDWRFLRHERFAGLGQLSERTSKFERSTTLSTATAPPAAAHPTKRRRPSPPAGRNTTSCWTHSSAASPGSRQCLGPCDRPCSAPRDHTPIDVGFGGCAGGDQRARRMRHSPSAVGPPAETVRRLARFMGRCGVAC